MYLAPCVRPEGPLETAPLTALVSQGQEGRQWQAFWADDDYVVRASTDEGTAWFRVADEPAGAPRVLRFRGPYRRRIVLVYATSAGGRRMLIGGTARKGR